MSSTVMGLLLPTALGLFLAAIAVAFGDINLLFPHNRLKENGGESNTVALEHGPRVTTTTGCAIISFDGEETLTALGQRMAQKLVICSRRE